MTNNQLPILFIDTSDYEHVQIALIFKQTLWHKFDSRNLSEQLLLEINKFLNKQKIKLNQIKKIAVVTGPGGFSRIRTGVATANALAFGLSIPILGLKQDKITGDLAKTLAATGGKMVAPIYDKEPNITLKK